MSRNFEPPTADTPLFRKADIILTIALIVMGLAMSFFLTFGNVGGADGTNSAAETQLAVTVDGKPYGTWPMSKNRQITVRQAGHSNIFEIKDGQARMLRSDCRGQDCIGEGAISRTGETIVCLPNRVVLEITGGEEAFDAIAQ